MMAWIRWWWASQWITYPIFYRINFISFDLIQNLIESNGMHIDNMKYHDDQIEKISSKVIIKSLKIIIKKSNTQFFIELD